MPKNLKKGCTLGRQLTIDYYNCSRATLLDCDALEKAFVTAARNSGATVISSSFHALAPLPWNYDGQKSMFSLPYSFFADFWIIRVKKETTF